MTIHLHVLKGCSPAPLANYLKALGILRLVGEQADKPARGWWDGEYFCLLTRLSKPELETFFLERYQPTPLLSPWNKGCGFFKADDPGLVPLEKSQAARFERFRCSVTEARQLLDAVAHADAVIRAIKARTKTNKTFQSKDQRQLLEHCDTYRGCLDQLQTQLAKPDLAADKRAEIKRDISTIKLIVLPADKPPQRAEAEALKASTGYKRLLAAAERRFKSLKATLIPDCRRLWRGPHAEWLSAAVVLLMEGSLLLTSRATRRLDPTALSRASAPFAVRPHAAGFATPGSEKAQRGEQWMPLWRQAATLPEVVAMYGEARVQLNRQTANRPVDMARAISRFGVARGIEAFVRYGYLERNGQSTLAVPLGRVHVLHHPRAYLIDDLAGWMDRVQRRNRDKHAPARLVHAEQRLADAVFSALMHDYTPDRWQAILEAAAAIEAIQATGTAIEAGPIPPLRPEWACAIDDSSPEVRLALSLGSAAANYFKGHPIDPVRHHWLPMEPKRWPPRFKTADKRLVKDPRTVMSGRDPIRDLSAIVERRLIEAGMKGKRRSQLVAARGCGARLDDLAQFLRGSLDLDKLLGLARAFMAIKWDKWLPAHCLRSVPSAELPEETWLTVRLACLPWPLTRDKDIPADPRIVRLLSSGEGSRAIEIGRTRLRSAGIRPPLQAGVADNTSARLWAAALAFPINRGSALRAAAILDPSMKGLLHV